MTRRAADVLCALSLAIAAAAFSWHASAVVGAALAVHGPQAGGYDDVWFDADAFDVHHRLTTRDFQQNQTIRHPLVALGMRLPLRVLMRSVDGADPVLLIRLLLALGAAAWAAVFFGALRAIGHRTTGALAFGGLAVASAATVFSFGVAETFALGALSVAPMLALVGAARGSVPREWLTVLAVSATFAVTISNGMFGVVGAWVLHPWRRAAQVVVNAVCVVLVLWGVQRMIYPSSGFPYGYDSSYRPFILSRDMNPPPGPIFAFFSHGVVMPRVDTVRRLTQENYDVLSVQRAWPANGGVVQATMTAAWAALLAAGVRALWRRGAPDPVAAFLAISVGGQLALHLVFGEETFLYSMHYVPPLIAIASLAALDGARAAVPVAAILALALAVHNIQQLHTSAAIAARIVSGIIP